MTEIDVVAATSRPARLPEPLFYTSTLTVGFNNLIFPLGQARDKVVAAPSTHFVFDAGASSDIQLVLHSSSGHSHLLVSPDGALLQTGYSGPYVGMDVDAQKLRSEYACEKLRGIIGLIRLIGADVALFGATVHARVAGEESTIAHLRRAAAAALGVQDALGEGGPVYDFQVRASRVVEEDVFSNLQVSWFEERTFNMAVMSSQMMVRPLMQLREWNATLVAEGLQFTYDRNNKRGLFGGKRVWADTEIEKILADSFAGASIAFGRLHDQVLAQWEGSA